MKRTRKPRLATDDGKPLQAFGYALDERGAPIRETLPPLSLEDQLDLAKRCLAEAEKELTEAQTRCDELEEAAGYTQKDYDTLESECAEQRERAESNQPIVDAAYAYCYHNTPADRATLVRALEDAGYMYLQGA